MKDYEFKGRWIAASTDIEDRFAPLFKKVFKLEKIIKNRIFLFYVVQHVFNICSISPILYAKKLYFVF